MYEIEVASTKVEKKIKSYISMRSDIIEKFERLKVEPRKANGAHPLKGELLGKWACWLGSNIRIIYLINDIKKIIYIISIGTHKVY